jgi:hypothetical protein
MRSSNLLKTIGPVVLLCVAGCGKRQVMQPSSVVPAECEVVAAPTNVPDTISVAVFDAPGPADAPLPHNAGQRLVFHHLYETLITVDCRGEVRGALAASWQKGDRGRRWTLELREGARFWDGRPVTAWDVEWWWKAAMRGRSAADAAVDSIVVSGDRVLDVFVEERHRGVPLFLASPAFAVAAPSYDSVWPNGSGPFRPLARPAQDRTGVLLVQPAFGGTSPVIRFVHASVRDARDLIDNEVDALITADPDVIDYARARPRLETVALPWDKTYVLLSGSRVSGHGNGGSPPSFSAETLDGLVAGRRQLRTIIRSVCDAVGGAGGIPSARHGQDRLRGERSGRPRPGRTNRGTGVGKYGGGFRRGRSRCGAFAAARRHGDHRR